MQVTTNSYDALNRLTQVSTIDNLIAVGYDLEGNVTSVADDDSDLTFAYDGLNRVLTAATGAGGVQPLVTLTNAFDAVGNRISLTDDAGVSGAVTGFAFDGAGRLTQLTTPSGQPIGLDYDPAGRLTGLTFPNTVSTTIAYELTTGWLAQLTHAAGATPLADFGYGYNGVGNVTQIAELTQTRNFSYDDLRRLTAGGTAAAPESYAYDPEGNRTVSHLSVGHVTDTANRLTEDDSFCYAYDLNGNLASKTTRVAGTCTGAVTSYTYDAQDQLIRIDFPDLSFAAYRYDGPGRRTEKDVNGSVTRLSMTPATSCSNTTVWRTCAPATVMSSGSTSHWRSRGTWIPTEPSRPASNSTIRPTTRAPCARSRTLRAWSPIPTTTTAMATSRRALRASPIPSLTPAASSTPRAGSTSTGRATTTRPRVAS